MPHRAWIWLGTLAFAAALLAPEVTVSKNGGRSPDKKEFCLAFIPFNSTRPLFRGNAALRRAVNWAVDRTDYAAESNAQTPWTHLLPPDAPGSIRKAQLQPYGTRANMTKARAIAAGHFRDGTITVYHSTSGPNGPARAEGVRGALIDLGFDPANITMRGFAGFRLYDEMAKRKSPWDLAVSVEGCSEDPAAFMHPTWYFPKSGKYRRRIAAALRLTRRPARNKALGKLDLEMTRNLAPVAVMAAS